MNFKLTASEIAKFLGVTEMFGDNRTVTNIKSAYNADPDSLTFSIDEPLTKRTRAGVIICSEKVGTDSTLIIVKNPKEAFVKVVRDLILKIQDNYTYIHPSTVINPEANVKIGKNVKIGPNCSIGFDGFGYVDLDGKLVNFPHLGGVVIEDNVEIGANVCIDRGALEDTVIGEGTKIDNLVHIAHNVKIGKNCIIVCQSMFGGSSKIGDNVWIGPGVTTLENIEIGDNALIGMGSVVTRNIRSNWIAFGSPAKEVRQRD